MNGSAMPANDLSIYRLDAKTWWDDRHGPMAPLHWLTPARFSIISAAWPVPWQESVSWM